MKRTIAIAAALMTAALLICTAAAEPGDDGGKKFDTWWAVPDCTIYISREENAFRVVIERIDAAAYTGAFWVYSCLYRGEDDALVSVASEKTTYAFNPLDVDEVTFNDPSYRGPDDESTRTVFTVTEEGRLVWADGRENAGAGLEFGNIGRFTGSWKNESANVYAEFIWSGFNGSFCYHVLLRSGPDSLTVTRMTGVYNGETGKLECTAADGEGPDGTPGDVEQVEAFFSRTEDGGILFEGDVTVELEEDPDLNG